VGVTSLDLLWSGLALETADRAETNRCRSACLLELVGARYLLVVLELVLGPKRFTDIREGLPWLSPDVLACGGLTFTR